LAACVPIAGWLVFVPLAALFYTAHRLMASAQVRTH
jgi:hypothetical protein